MTSNIRLKGSCVVAALLMTAVAAPAQAASRDPHELAVQLRDESRALGEANRWAAACKKLESSLRYEPALATYLQLGRCYEKLGKRARGWRMYRKAVGLARAAGNQKARALAQARAAALEPQLARIELSAPERIPEGFAVTWDGRPVETGALGATFYADAGDHRLVASAPGRGAFATTIRLAANTTRRFAIPGLTGSEHAVAEATITSSEEVDDDENGLVTALSDVPALATGGAISGPLFTRKSISIGLATTGLATIGSGIVFGAKASALYGDAQALCGPRLTCSLDNYATGAQLVRDARANSTAAKLLIGAGGVVTLAGAILLLTAPSPKAQRSLRVAPVPHERGGGLAVLGRF